MWSGVMKEDRHKSSSMFFYVLREWGKVREGCEVWEGLHSNLVETCGHGGGDDKVASGTS